MDIINHPLKEKGLNLMDYLKTNVLEEIRNEILVEILKVLKV